MNGSNRNWHNIKRNITWMSASFMVLPLVIPNQEIKAEEKAATTETKVKQLAMHPFLNDIIPSATSIAAKNDLYASVMLAQAVLESGWGKSSLGSAPNYNLFGIKGDYEGESVVKDTLEDSGNQDYYEIVANFRKYPSYKESLEDYAHLLKNGTNWDPNYYSGAWKSNAVTYKDATNHLTGRYATDAAYATKLNRIIEEHQLTIYDTPATEKDLTETPVQTGNKLYTVKAGDTLYKISREHNISLVDLMEWNNLNSSMIHPGMTLKTGKVSQTQPEKPVTPAPVENTKPKPATPTAKTYQVKAGDTLWQIGQKNNISVAKIKELNQLKNDVIQPGQTLRFSVVETAPVQQEENEQARSFITVTNGDTLYRIASKAGLSVTELKALNQLRSDLIVPGQKLFTTKTVQNVEVTQPKPVEQKPVVTQAHYTVQKGDTLYNIASKTGMTVEQIKTTNQLRSDLIFVGQTLQIKEAEPTVAKPAEQATNKTYQVQKGDTLYAIAKKLSVSVTSLMEWNNVNSSLIRPGQLLQIK